MRFNISLQIQQVEFRSPLQTGYILKVSSLDHWPVIPFHSLAVYPISFHCYRSDTENQDLLPLQRSFRLVGLGSWLSLEVGAWRTFSDVVGCCSSIWVSMTQMSSVGKIYDLCTHDIWIFPSVQISMCICIPHSQKNYTK